jgi:hypothetical protein
MAGNTIETVVFNEGEPLDPDKLNKVQSNIVSVYSTTGLLNTTVTGIQGQITTSLTDSGKVLVTGMSTDKFGSVSVPVSGSFTSNAIIVATVAQTLGDSVEDILIYVGQVSGGSFKIAAKSSIANRKQVYVNYIITEKKTVTS